MSRLVKGRKRVSGRPRSFRPRIQLRQPLISGCELDSSARLIAPPHSLRLPTLAGVRTRFQFSLDSDAALPLARALIGAGAVEARHLEKASSPAEGIQVALAEMAHDAFGDGPDQFSIELGISEVLDEDRKPEENVLFFTWNNTSEPQYIPLRPIYERLEGSPLREQLMATLYEWLYQTASRVFDRFGFAEAEHIYQWRRDAYISERDAGEDVDLEGEVEYADPEKVVSYIRNSHELKLKTYEIAEAIQSITDPRLRTGFEKAHQMFVDSRAIRLPVMPKRFAQLVDDAAYYMDASPLPGLGISHWRDDPVVAWFDEHCRDQFEAGTTPRAPIILCFRPTDTEFLLKIVKILPRMMRTVARLSEWVRFAEELENASHYTDRPDSGFSAEAGNTDL